MISNIPRFTGIAQFAEELRQSDTDRMTIVGVLPGVLMIESGFPTVLPKFAVLITLRFSIRNLPPSCKYRLISTWGLEYCSHEEPDLMAIVRRSGLSQENVLMAIGDLSLTELRVPVEGRMSVEVEVDGRWIEIGAIRFVSESRLPKPFRRDLRKNPRLIAPILDIGSEA